jgi:plastocyanin
MRMRILIVPAVVAGAMASASCGGDSGPAGPSSNLPTINIVGQNGAQAFAPNPAAFGGQQIVFKNSDSVVHRVVFNDGSVDTGDISPGATSRAVTMPSDGTNYHCTIHTGMIGSVNPASGGAPPACEGSYCDGY